MKVRRVSNHAYIDAISQKGGSFPIYRGKRRTMMRGGGRFSFLFNMGKKLLAPIGKKILSSAKKKIVPIIAERGSQLLSGGLTPKQAVKAVMQDSAKAMLGTTRRSLEKELAKGQKRKRKQKGRGLMQRRKKQTYKKA